MVMADSEQMLPELEEGSLRRRNGHEAKRSADMEAYAVFEAGREKIRARLEAAQDANEAASAAAEVLERIAGELAQDEEDELARQRQQAVLALARRAPLCLRAARAQGRLVVENGLAGRLDEDKLDRGLKLAGLGLLLALAVAEMVNGRLMFAVLQLAGSALLLTGLLRAGSHGVQGRGAAHAEAVTRADAAELLRAVGELCQAADICVSDLQLLERDGARARISGTADEATLDLLVSLLEAQTTGRGDVALRRLDQVRTYLKALGIETVEFTAGDLDCARMFDVLPTLGEARTVRPALVKDGEVLRRGMAVCAAVQAR